MELPSLPRLTRAPRRSARGAPVALPRGLDAVAERWWRLGPRTRTIVLLVLVVTALALVGRGATASPWGPPRPVLVAATDLPPGHAVAPADTRSASWPAGLVPADALRADELPDDARLTGSAPAGTVLTRRHLVAGVAGMVDPGHAAVALPVDGLPPAASGDTVDVVAAAADGTGRRVATAARVLTVEGGFLWLGVPGDQVDAVAAAGAAGRLTLAVRPAAPPP